MVRQKRYRPGVPARIEAPQHLPYDEGVQVVRRADGSLELHGRETVSIPGMPSTVAKVLAAAGWLRMVASLLHGVRIVSGRRFIHGVPVGGSTLLRAKHRVATVSAPACDNGHPVTVAIVVAHEACHHLHPDPVTSEVIAQEGSILLATDLHALGIGLHPSDGSYGWQLDAIQERGGFLYAEDLRRVLRTCQRMGNPPTMSLASYAGSPGPAPTTAPIRTNTRRTGA